MAGQLTMPAAIDFLAPWTVLFAREPEPDPDLDDIPTGSMDRGRPGMAPVPPPHRSSRGPWVLLVLLLIVAGAVYLYMEPEVLRGILPESVMDLLSEAPQAPAPPGPEPGPETLPPIAAAPSDKPDAAQLPASTPPSPGAQPETGGGPSAPALAPPSASPPGEPARPEMPPAPPTAGTAVPEPRFGESQLVTLRRDPTAPDRPIALTADAAGTKPGPLVRPGTALKILDGELQSGVWVYSVKTMEGTKGWLSEDRLQPNP
jgi:hypothetical protein